MSDYSQDEFDREFLELVMPIAEEMPCMHCEEYIAALQVHMLSSQFEANAGTWNIELISDPMDLYWILCVLLDGHTDERINQLRTNFMSSLAYAIGAALKNNGIYDEVVKRALGEDNDDDGDGGGGGPGVHPEPPNLTPSGSAARPLPRSESAAPPPSGG